MALQTPADLHAAVEQRFPDNTSEEITPETTREFLHALIDTATAAPAGPPPSAAAAAVALSRPGSTQVRLKLNAVAAGRPLAKPGVAGLGLVLVPRGTSPTSGGGSSPGLDANGYSASTGWQVWGGDFPADW